MEIYLTLSIFLRKGTYNMFIRFFFVAVLVSFLSAESAIAAVRTWTSTNGKTLEAEYVKCSANKVVLRKSSGQTVAIPLSYLSEDDQRYISDQVHSSREIGSSLSKSEISQIVENYESLSKKFSPGPGIPNELFGAHLNSEQQHGVVELFGTKARSWYRRTSMGGRYVDHVRFKESDYPYVLIRIDYKPPQTTRKAFPDTNGWLYLLDNGTIKYDPLYYPHPVEVAFERLSQLINFDAISRYEGVDINDKTDRLDSWNETLRAMVASGVPTFGLSNNQTAQERKKSLEKLIMWLRKDAADWDVGDPIIPMHSDAYKDMLDDFEKHHKSLFREYYDL